MTEPIVKNARFDYRGHTFQVEELSDDLVWTGSWRVRHVTTKASLKVRRDAVAGFEWRCSPQWWLRVLGHRVSQRYTSTSFESALRGAAREILRTDKIAAKEARADELSRTQVSDWMAAHAEEPE